LQERSKANKRQATQNDEIQNRLASKHDKLHEIIWEIELFIVYARKNQDSTHNGIRQEEWKIINHCNEIYGACWHKMRFYRFLKEHTNVKNTSTDDGDKPEKVYKYDDRDGLSDSDDSQESSPCRPARVSNVTPPPGALDVCTPILVSV
jgi:hypothetical protein